MNVPEGLKYSTDHEWINVEEGVATVGITDFAQGELGDIIFIEFPDVGDEFGAGDTFGTVEAVKTVADMYAPVACEVIEVNTSLEDTPETVNTDPYNEGWIVKIKMTNPQDLEKLMDAAAYKEHIA